MFIASSTGAVTSVMLRVALMRSFGINAVGTVELPTTVAMRSGCPRTSASRSATMDEMIVRSAPVSTTKR